MIIKKVKCYQFSNHFLKSLHAPKSIDPARLRYPVGKSAQGSNPKVTIGYSIKLLLECSKPKSRKRACTCRYVNATCSPLTVPRAPYEGRGPTANQSGATIKIKAQPR